MQLTYYGGTSELDSLDLMQIFQYFFLKFPEFSTITKHIFATIFLKQQHFYCS